MAATQTPDNIYCGIIKFCLNFSLKPLGPSTLMAGQTRLYDILKYPVFTHYHWASEKKQRRCHLILATVHKEVFYSYYPIKTSVSKAWLTRQHIIITNVMFLRNSHLVLETRLNRIAKHDLHTIATRIEKSWMWSSTLDMMDWSCGKQIKLVCSCSKSQRDTY